WRGPQGHDAAHQPSPSGERIDRQRLTHATAALHHRGPDGSGLWVSPDGQVGLGHRRLSIIAPDNGAQPLSNEDGTVWATINGELYGFEAQRRELEAGGHRFRTDSDSEVLVHLFEAYGERWLSHLRGEFAFVLWDGRQRTLWAARDRFGIKPLCMARWGDTIGLASEAKALFAAGLQPRWDRQALLQAAHTQYLQPHQTLFAGIEALPPGWALRIDAQGRQHRWPYWQLDVDPSPDRSRSDEAWLTDLDRQLRNAVRLRTRADAPVCVQLSGGIDSSTVLALAAQERPVTAFSVSFEATAYDELAIARQVAAHVGVEHEVVRLTGTALMDAMGDAVEASEGLAINGHLPAKYLLHQAIRRAGFKVVLTGAGADELLAGYPHLRMDLFRREGHSEAMAALMNRNAALRGIMLAHGQGLALDGVRARLGHVPAWMEAKAGLGWRLRQLIAPEHLDGEDRCATLVDGFDVEGQLAGRHPVRQSMATWTWTALSGYILRTLGDGTEMPHSIEGRVPFLDHNLFVWARRAPVDLLIRDGVEKYPLREVTRGLLPEVVRTREKRPFIAPPVSRFASVASRERVRQAVRACAAPTVGVFATDRIERLLDRLEHKTDIELAAIDPVVMMIWSTALLEARYRLASA
ncbi:MAG: asparagine synthase (glutamine-hydrolyzing), partial [Myxococcota bacterium]